MNPPGSAITCPVLTKSPTATTGFAGAPRSWAIETYHVGGTGSISIAHSRENFESSGWTPPMEKVNLLICRLLLICSRCRKNREIQGVNSTCGTFRNTFLAEFAFIEVNIGQIVSNRNRIVRADLGALATANARCQAGFARYCTFVFIDAGDEYPHRARTFVAKFDDVLRAGLDTGTAGGTFRLVYNRQSRDRIHRDGAELARSDAVTAAQAAERAACLSAVESSHYLAGLHAVIDIGARPIGAGSIAADDCDLRSFFLHLLSKDGSYFLHNFITPHRTKLAV